MFVPALWLGATILTGAGLAFLAARISNRDHSESKSWDLPAGNWRDVMDALPMGLAVYDANERLVFCNEPWRRLFADMAGLARVGGLYGDTVFRISGRRASDGPGASLAGERQLDGGTWVRFDELRLDGGGLLVGVSDITKERTRASEARVERDKSRMIISAAGAWIWETDVLHRFSVAIPVRSELTRDDFRWMIGRGLAELGSPAAAGDNSVLSRCIEDMQEHHRQAWCEQQQNNASIYFLNVTSCHL